MEHFFLAGPDVVKCILPYKTYIKKLGFACCKLSVMYSKLESNAIILAFYTLRQILQLSSDSTMFEAMMKKMYNEFAKESKVGGGAFQVQERLRISQNCFVELLSENRSIAY